MFLFKKKHDPVVNAILRGVYTKDKPLDLDKGKFENRLTLLKVPRITNERILRVSPDMIFVNDEIVYTGTTDKQTIAISKENTLFNRVNLTIVTTGDAVEFWIKVRYNESQNSYITLKNFSSTANDSDILSYDLPTQLYFSLEYQLTNATDQVEINYTFYFENPVKEAIDNIELQQIAINSDLTNLQAIISDIANIETQEISIESNLNNLQAIIADIANIESQQILIQGDLSNLQAIIANIANIETQNIAIAGDTNNLQAIITDIANIETQLISIETTNATINTAIGTINTAITAIQATNATIDVSIGNVEDLDLEISTQMNKSVILSGTITTGTDRLLGTIDSEFLYNAVSMVLSSAADHVFSCRIYFQDADSNEFLRFPVVSNATKYFNDYYFPATKLIKVYMYNTSVGANTISYNFKFSLTHQTRDNAFSNSGILKSSKVYVLHYKDITLVNRLSYVFYNASAAQSYTITIKAKIGNDDGTVSYITLTNDNLTGAAGVVLQGVISFTEVSDIQIHLGNNNAVDCHFESNLFFSKIYTDEQIVEIIEANGLNLDDGKVFSSQDADLTFNFGRCALGSPATDIMYIAHIDHLSITNYLLRQKADGNARFNVPTARQMDFCVNNVVKATLNASQLQMSVPINFLTLTTPIITDNVAQLSTLGRCQIGAAGSGYAYFGYRGLGATTYMIRQNSTFETCINSATGKLIRFYINAVQRMFLSATELDMAVTIDMNQNKVIDCADPENDQDVATKKWVVDNFTPL